jgi:hypothetical protein
MSGPIVRKYGFPNFEKIFGERGLQHGVDEGEAPVQGGDATSDPGDASAPEAEAKAEAKPASKKPKKK